MKIEKKHAQTGINAQSLDGDERPSEVEQTRRLEMGLLTILNLAAMITAIQIQAFVHWAGMALLVQVLGAIGIKNLRLKSKAGDIMAKS